MAKRKKKRTLNVKKVKNGYIITGSKAQCDSFERKFNLMQFADRTLHPSLTPYWWRY